MLVGKPLAALAVVALLGYSSRTALTVALGLAQIGEFSFILADLARQHGLLPDAGHSVLVACALVSIALNPFLFRALDRLEGRLRAAAAAVAAAQRAASAGATPRPTPRRRGDRGARERRWRWSSATGRSAGRWTACCARPARRPS